MGGQHHIGEGEQPLHRGGLQNGVGEILKDILRLLLVDVQAYGKEFVVPDAGDQIFGADQGAPGGVDQNNPILHFCDGVGVDQVPGVRGQGAVEADQVAAAEQIIQGDKGEPVQILPGVGIVGQHLHAEALANSGHGQADLTGAYDAGGLVVEVHPHQSGEGKVVLPALDIGLVGVTVGGEGQGHGVFRHRLRGVAGDPQHRNLVAGGGLQVHIVVTSTAHQDDLDAALGQPVNHRPGQVCVDKGADTVVTLGQGGGFRHQIGLNIFDFQSGIFR